MSDYDPDPDLDLTPPPVGSQYHDVETEVILLELRDLISDARPVPLSASSMISKEEVLAIIDEAIHNLPEELRAARWLLKEREEYLNRVRHEGDELLEHARTRAEQMVQRTEVVKSADQRAYQIVENAEAEARRLRHEVEDFCDQKLASFEIVLERTQKLVTAGRAKLQGTNLLGDQGEDDEALRQATLPPPPDAVAGGGDAVEYYDDEPDEVGYVPGEAEDAFFDQEQS